MNKKKVMYLSIIIVIIILIFIRQYPQLFPIAYIEKLLVIGLPDQTEILECYDTRLFPFGGEGDYFAKININRKYIDSFIIKIKEADWKKAPLEDGIRANIYAVEVDTNIQEGYYYVNWHIYPGTGFILGLLDTQTCNLYVLRTER